MKLDQEFAEKVTKLQSAEEILAFAKECGETLTKEQAEAVYAQLQQDGALTDTELDSVTGGDSTAANRNLSRIHRVENLKKKKNSTEDSTD